MIPGVCLCDAQHTLLISWSPFIVLKLEFCSLHLLTLSLECAQIIWSLSNRVSVVLLCFQQPFVYVNFKCAHFADSLFLIFINTLTYLPLSVHTTY